MERTPKITDARAMFVNMMYRCGYITRQISDFFIENDLKRNYVSIRHLRDLVDDKRKQDGEFGDLFNDIYEEVKALDSPPKL